MTKPRVEVPAGEVWWANGVLSDADFLRKFAEGLAAADPRADRLYRIADGMRAAAEPPAPQFEDWNGDTSIPLVEPPAPRNAARGFCQLQNVPACDNYPACQCGRSVVNRP